MGYLYNSKHYALPEESLFLVQSGKATYTITEEGIEEGDSFEDLLTFMLAKNLASLNSYRAYASLKELGYVVWGPRNPYLLECSFSDSIDPSCAFVVMKPNSRFKKTDPSGFVFCLYLSSADSTFFSQLPRKGLICASDETGQLFLEIGDVTEDILVMK